jgi:Asp/Glu/hydantoin racemase
MIFHSEEHPEVDFDRVEEEVVFHAQRLITEAPDVGAIVLECTNLPPYARAIQRATKRPIFDIVTLTNMVHAAVVQPQYTWSGS